MMMRAVLAIIQRELARTLRQRGRLLSALVRPLIWLLVIGGGVETMMPSSAGTGYRAFLAPGLLAMTLLFGAMLSALSLVHDRESGVLRLLLVAPIHHAWIIIARILSAAVVALVQAGLLLLLLWPAGYVGAGWDPIVLLAGLVATALAAACLGMLVAVAVRGLENFAVMMNFVIFPLFFLSGALYPLHGLPPWLRLAALANPFSYGVDLLKHAAPAAATGYRPDASLGCDLGVLAGFIVLAATAACLVFCQATTIGALARLVSRARGAAS
jgi:ABC-2 type transport system permease protein